MPEQTLELAKFRMIKLQMFARCDKVYKIMESGLNENGLDFSN